jgi:hypothetical protein
MPFAAIQAALHKNGPNISIQICPSGGKINDEPQLRLSVILNCSGF